MRIVFADDHNLIRETVGILISKISSDVELVEASSWPEAMSKAASGATPDLIILDLYMPGMNHLDGVKETQSRFPHVPVVILTGAVDLDDAYAAMELGAAGYIPKTIGSKAMMGALRTVLSGEKFMPSMLVADSEKLHGDTRDAGKSTNSSSPLDKLTPRERDVVQLLTAGHPNKEIARHLGLQEITVKVHLKGIYRKLGVGNRTQAVRTVLELGLDSSIRRQMQAGAPSAGAKSIAEPANADPSKPPAKVG